MLGEKAQCNADAAWVAGLFEGEGSITFNGKYSVCLQLTSTDKDIVFKFMRLVNGFGNIYSQVPNGRKPYWLWSAGAKEEVSLILSTIMPFLGERRSKRANEALARLVLNPGRLYGRAAKKVSL